MNILFFILIIFVTGIISWCFMGDKKMNSEKIRKVKYTKVPKRGTIKYIEKFIEAKNVNVNYSSNDNAPMKACSNNDLAVVKELIKTGADINAKDKNGESLLMKACSNNDLAVVKELIEAGADVNVREEHKIMRVCLNGQSNFIKGNRKNKDEENEDLNINKEDYEEESEKRLNDNCDNSEDQWYMKGFYYEPPVESDMEYERERYERCQEQEEQEKQEEDDEHFFYFQKPFITSEPKREEVIIKNWTPLMTATQKGYINIVKELIYAEVDVNVKNSDGHTALTLASGENRREVIKFMKEAGAIE